MKVEVIDATKTKKSKRELSKILTLDEIEAKMIQLATAETDDVVQLMLNEKRISMLEKIANLKIHRLQLKELEMNNVVATVEPLTVQFISSKTEEQRKRLERIDNEIIGNKTLKQNA